jgi:hypothetical protein
VCCRIERKKLILINSKPAAVVGSVLFHPSLASFFFSSSFSSVSLLYSLLVACFDHPPFSLTLSSCWSTNFTSTFLTNLINQPQTSNRPIPSIRTDWTKKHLFPFQRYSLLISIKKSTYTLSSWVSSQTSSSSGPIDRSIYHLPVNTVRIRNWVSSGCSPFGALA